MDLATNNDFDVTFEEAGEYTFTSQNGIFSEWWGSPLGADITANGSGEPNLNAPVLKDWFSTLPSFTVSVKKMFRLKHYVRSGNIRATGWRCIISAGYCDTGGCNKSDSGVEQ